jgi:hypothetical protein
MSMQRKRFSGNIFCFSFLVDIEDCHRQAMDRPFTAKTENSGTSPISLYASSITNPVQKLFFPVRILVESHLYFFLLHNRFSFANDA